MEKFRQRTLRYFFDDPEPLNDDPVSAMIWCLGIAYPHESEAASSSIQTDDKSSQPVRSHFIWPESFLDDFESRLWMTYRTDFPLISRTEKSPPPLISRTAADALRLAKNFISGTGSSELVFSHSDGYNSDIGWGCMIRSAQAVLSNALLLAVLGRDWRISSGDRRDRDIIRLFADDERAPYSIHQFVRLGEMYCDKAPGEWFGPNAAARCIQRAVCEYNERILRVYIGCDGADLYEEAFLETSLVNGEFLPTLVLIGVRLGIENINPVYFDALEVMMVKRI